MADEIGPYSSGEHFAGQGTAGPRHPQRWKHSPNFLDWLPGDVVLLAKHSGNWGSLGIALYQGSVLQMPADSAKWTHAGIYVGQGALIEAVPSSGVGLKYLSEYLDVRTACVRRVEDRTGSLTNGHRLADYAQRALNNQLGYDWKTVIGFAFGASKKKIGAPESDAVHCASLCEAAILMEFGIVVGKSTNSHVLPGHFFRHLILQSVSVGWLQL